MKVPVDIRTKLRIKSEESVTGCEVLKNMDEGRGRQQDGKNRKYTP
jgi:hypothetical protein